MDQQKNTFAFQSIKEKTKLYFIISSSEIRIRRRNDQGTLSHFNGPEEIKIELIAEYITSKKLWELRTNGFAELATSIREIQISMNLI